MTERRVQRAEAKFLVECVNGKKSTRENRRVKWYKLDPSRNCREMVKVSDPSETLPPPYGFMGDVRIIQRSIRFIPDTGRKHHSQYTEVKEFRLVQLPVCGSVRHTL